MNPLERTPACPDGTAAALARDGVSVILSETPNNYGYNDTVHGPAQIGEKECAIAKYPSLGGNRAIFPDSPTPCQVTGACALAETVKEIETYFSGSVPKSTAQPAAQHYGAYQAYEAPHTEPPRMHA